MLRNRWVDTGVRGRRQGKGKTVVKGSKVELCRSSGERMFNSVTVVSDTVYVPEIHQKG